MGEWIEHTGDCKPVPDGTKIDVRRRCGITEYGIVVGSRKDMVMNPDGTLVPYSGPFYGSAWLWGSGFPEFNYVEITHYRLHDDGQAEAETRKARMADFYKIAAGRDHLIEETLKTRKPVSAPQKAGE